MDEGKIALKLVMDRLHLGNSTFPERLVLQKAVFLLQESLGLEFGYRYNWYLHGPYSPELTRDAFDISGNETYYVERARENGLSPTAKSRLKRFETQFGGYLESARKMELLASLAFAHKRWGNEDPAQRLLKVKPQFTKQEVKEAAKILGLS